MSRPPVFPAEDKIRIVLSVLAGEVTVAEAARRNKVSETSIGKWKQQFLEAGKAGLAAGGSSPSSTPTTASKQRRLASPVSGSVWARSRSRRCAAASTAGWQPAPSPAPHSPPAAHAGFDSPRSGTDTAERVLALHHPPRRAGALIAAATAAAITVAVVGHPRRTRRRAPFRTGHAPPRALTGHSPSDRSVLAPRQRVPHLVDVHIGNLHRKLAVVVAAPRYLHAVRSVGYPIADGRVGGRGQVTVKA